MGLRRETTTMLPTDLNSAPIQVLAIDESAVVELPIQAGNNRVALAYTPANSQIVEVTATSDCRIAFGDSTVDVTAGTRRIMMAGTAVYKLLPGTTHVAVTALGGGSGYVTVSRML